MRRLIITLLVLLGLLVTASPAEARWGCGWGWGGGWHRGCGWGWGGGWGGYRYCGYGGWGGWGGYGIGFARPFVGLYPSYYYPAYNYPLINYGCYGYGCGLNYATPINIGYYTSAPSYYSNANANFFVRSLPQPRVPIAASVTALDLQRFLALRGEVRPVDLALSDFALPKMSGRVSNVDARQRAMRFLAEGDTLFRAQNFNSALQKYKLASVAAPDVAESYWRQGHAFVATKNFDQATTAFKRAIALADNLGRGGFRLDDLYGDSTITKAGHLENLAGLALTRSDDADSFFLIGVFLNYDGQTERAEKFFDRASDLAGISGGHIAVFLDHEPAAPVVSRPATPRPPAPALFTSASGLEI